MIGISVLCGHWCFLVVFGGFCGILWDSVGATGLRVTICDSCDTCDSVGATGLGLRPRNDGLL